VCQPQALRMFSYPYVPDSRTVRPAQSRISIWGDHMYRNGPLTRAVLCFRKSGEI
jgi:hypothetical protein